MTMHPIDPRVERAVLYETLPEIPTTAYVASPVCGGATYYGHHDEAAGGKPTAGFLLSYPLAACLTGWLAERRFDRQYLTSFVAMAAGLAVIFTGGLSWYAWGPPGLGFERAMSLAVLPFIPADLVKLAIAAGVLPVVWRFLGAPQARR